MRDQIPTGWTTSFKNPNGSWTFIYPDQSSRSAYGYFWGGKFVVTNVSGT